MTKRICSLLLTLCLIFSLSTFAFATNGAHKTVDYIAQDWIDTQFSGDAEVSDTIVLPNESGSKTVGNITGANDIRALVMGDMPNVTPGEGNCGPSNARHNMKLPHFSHFILPQMS